MSERRIVRLVNGEASIVEDAWTLFEDGAAWNGEPYALIPLATALTQPQRLDSAAPAGIWLAPTDEPADAVPLFGSIELIAVQFPKFGDGRGFSTAALLRRRHGWRGQLRAVGDVLRDQLYFMKRVGFDSFALRGDHSVEDALASLSDFTDSYQGSVEPELPAFRRIDPAVFSAR
ncbi:MAG: DUF934 domain-containing protein [Burkholderiaceae bacterium]|nr:DUF934 domain-containing protein [Burkholderiaceae bacterium]